MQQQPPAPPTPAPRPAASAADIEAAKATIYKHEQNMRATPGSEEWARYWRDPAAQEQSLDVSLRRAGTRATADFSRRGRGASAAWRGCGTSAAQSLSRMPDVIDIAARRIRQN